MRKSQRLQVVLELARRDEESAAKMFENLRSAYQTEVQKLEDLENYYQDYEAKFRSRTNGLRASDIANSRSLLQQIVMVQQGQKLQIQQAKNELDKGRLEWHKIHLKYEKLQELIRRYRIEETLEDDKKEQKMIDDWVSQTHSHSPKRLQ